MKKILFCMHAMEIGGAEKALLGLLENIDYSEYEVDLFLSRHEGELMDYIPKEVHLFSPVKEYSCLAVPMKTLIKNRAFQIAYGRLKAKILAKRFVRMNKLSADNAVELEYSHKYTKKYMPLISDKEYDLAVSFLTPHYFVAEKVNAKKKIAWIHTDYSLVDVDVTSELKMWGKYDYIASISDQARESFKKVFPSLSERVITIENIAPMNLIQKSAEEHIDEIIHSDNHVNLLSVGRFCYAKNFDNVPAICRRILDSGICVKWYLIGFGDNESLIRRKIAEYALDDNVIILGKKINPYPYIKACDVYVQPSRYEGKCVSVIEAQILHKPVIITAYPTSPSQLKDGYDGLIVPIDNEGCAIGIMRVIKDQQLCQQIAENTTLNDYSKKREVEKLMALI